MKVYPVIRALHRAIDVHDTEVVEAAASSAAAAAAAAAATAAASDVEVPDPAPGALSAAAQDEKTINAVNELVRVGRGARARGRVTARTGGFAVP